MFGQLNPDHHAALRYLSTKVDKIPFNIPLSFWRYFSIKGSYANDVRLASASSLNGNHSYFVFVDKNTGFLATETYGCIYLHPSINKCHHSCHSVHLNNKNITDYFIFLVNDVTNVSFLHYVSINPYELYSLYSCFK